MVKTCFIKGCRSESTGGCGVSFHRIPKNEEMRNKWRECLPASNAITKSSTICSRHFKADDFYTANSRQMLRNDAVPSIFPVSSKKMEDIVVKTEPVELSIEYNECQPDSVNQDIDVVKYEIDIGPSPLQHPAWTGSVTETIKLECIENEFERGSSTCSQNDSKSEERAKVVLQCNSTCSSPTERQDTKQDEDGTLSEMFECDKCELMFKERRNFKNHIVKCCQMQRETNESPVCRNEIYKAGETKNGAFSNRIVDHRRSASCDSTDTSDKISTSSVISSTDSVESRSKRHKRDPSQCKCSVCDKTFANKSKFETHMRIHTGVKPFSCAVCSKSFSQKSHLKGHMIVHTGEKPFTCSVCKKSVTTKFKLDVHMRGHTGLKPFECSVCSKSFARKYYLKIHMNVHTGVKPFTCSVCNKSVTTKFKLSDHMKIHTGVKMFVCPTCNKDFSAKSGLETHMKIHEGGKLYICPICDKALSDKSNLNVHMRIHTGVKPYTCSVCNRSFARKSTLNVHTRSHTGFKPFTCSVCNCNFTQLFNLKRHMNVHRKDNISNQCENERLNIEQDSISETT